MSYCPTERDLSIGGKIRRGLFNAETHMGAVMHSDIDALKLGDEVIDEVIDDDVTYRITHIEPTGSGVIIFRVRQPANP